MYHTLENACKYWTVWTEKANIRLEKEDVEYVHKFGLYTKITFYPIRLHYQDHRTDDFWAVNYGNGQTAIGGVGILWTELNVVLINHIPMKFIVKNQKPNQMTVQYLGGKRQRNCQNRTRTVHYRWYVHYDEPGSVYANEPKLWIFVER